MNQINLNLWVSVKVTPTKGKVNFVSSVRIMLDDCIVATRVVVGKCSPEWARKEWKKYPDRFQLTSWFSPETVKGLLLVA